MDQNPPSTYYEIWKTFFMTFILYVLYVYCKCLLSWTNCNLTFRGFVNLLSSMHLMNMIIKLLSTVKWFSAFFTGVWRFYGVLSMYHISNDKYVNHIKKDIVTMLIQHYRRTLVIMYQDAIVIVATRNKTYHLMILFV